MPIPSPGEDRTRRPTLVILAAGASRRYGRPKQLDPLGPGGETIMELTARDAVSAGVGRIVLVVGRETGPAVLERMRAAARRDGYADTLIVDAVEQRLDDLPPGFAPPAGRSRPWGTAHAVWACRRVIRTAGSPVIVTNADDWYGPDAIGRAVRWAGSIDSPGTCAMVPYPLEVTLPPISDRATPAGGVSRGIVRADAHNRLVGVEEVLHLTRDPTNPGTARGRNARGADVSVPLDRFCSMNLWAFGPEIVDLLDREFEGFLTASGSSLDSEWFLPDAVLAGAQRADVQVRILPPGTVWAGITHPQDRDRVRARLKRTLDPT